MQTNRWTERKAGRQAYIQIDGQTGRQTGRQAGRQTYTQADRQVGRQAADRRTGWQILFENSILYSRIRC